MVGKDTFSSQNRHLFSVLFWKRVCHVLEYSNFQMFFDVIKEFSNVSSLVNFQVPYSPVIDSGHVVVQTCPNLHPG